ncbi:MAG: DNA polymerase I [Candidatus Humimicrobiaceae bacterium]
MKNKLILIDGNNIAYRAFYALPQTIATSAGIMTNAVYGFTTMVLKLIEDNKPEYIITAFDSKAPTFRHELFKEYKAQRIKMPEELILQFPLIKEVLEALNIKCIEYEGFEADDIIASLASKLEDDFDEILVVSGDKDILQLVGGNIKVMALKKGMTDTVTYDKEGVIEKLGVTPERIKDLLALMGDSSDNIPGIKGIGPKSAVELLVKFENIEGIYEHLDDLKSDKTRNLLSENKKNAFDSRKLTELVRDLNLDICELLSKKLHEVNFTKVEKIFTSLEFRTLKDRIKKISIYCDAAKLSEFQVKETEQGLKAGSVIENQEFKRLSYNIFDLNFNIKEYINNSSGKLYLALSENLLNKNTYGINFSRDLVIYNSKENPYVFDSKFFNNKEYLDIIRKLLEDESIIKSGIELKEIYKYLKKHNIELTGVFHDYMIFYLLLNPDKTKIEINELLNIYSLNNNDGYYPEKPDPGYGFQKNLKLSSNTGCELKGQKDQLSLYLGSIGFADLSKENLNLIDNSDLGKSDNLKIVLNSIACYSRLEEMLLKEIKDNNLFELYVKIEGPLIKVLGEIEYTGVSIDKEYLKFLIEQYDKDISKLTDDIYEISKERFNINSPQQLSNILFKKLNLASARKTKTGLSTDAATLISLIDKNPIIAKILDYREKVKLKNTYIDILPGLISTEDNRLHTTYNQLGTTTGRLSSSEPNLQNIPVRTELGKQIRKAFIPGKGYDMLLSSDYSQIELRILAHLSEDEKLIDVFNNNGDIHTFTAAEIFNVNIKDVTEELRRKAKAINFGIIYGMTEYGLKSRLSISEEEAKEYIHLYFDRYPKVKKYINFLIKEAYDKGFAVTLFGRKRYINELGSSNGRLRNLGERLAVNTPIQGTAADIMKLSTVQLSNSIKKNKINANILLQVHDELVLELKEKDLKIIENIVKDSMENCVKLKVAIKVDIKSARNWYI